MSTAVFFRSLPGALRKLAWVLFTRAWAAWTWIVGGIWPLIALEDRYTHLYATGHGGSWFMLWGPGVAAIIFGFAGLIWLATLVIDNPWNKKK